MTLNQQIERWIKSRKDQSTFQERPFVTVAYAQSLDGSITTRRGEALAISGSGAIQITHQLRSLHDGILVGIETVLTDDPQLTVREWEGPNPQPVVLDSGLRMPPDARLCRHPDKRCWVLTVCPVSGEQNIRAEVLTVEKAEQPRVPLKPALKLLRDKGIRSLMVEGGATVITAFLRARLVDAMIVTIAPKVVGGYSAVSDLGINSIDCFPVMDPIFSGTIGKDVIVWGGMRFDGEQS